jgi:hypothetical protein
MGKGRREGRKECPLINVEGLMELESHRLSGDKAQGVQCLPSRHEALDPIPSTEKKEINRC